MSKDEFRKSIEIAIKSYPDFLTHGQKVFKYIDEVYKVARYIQYNEKVYCGNDDSCIDKFIDITYTLVHFDWFNIYQLRATRQHTFVLDLIGKYQTNGINFNDITMDKVWHLCNIINWDNNFVRKSKEQIIEYQGVWIKTTSTFLGFANSDLILDSPYGFYSCEPFEWKHIDSLEEGIKLLRTHIQFTDVHANY